MLYTRNCFNFEREAFVYSTYFPALYHDKHHFFVWLKRIEDRKETSLPALRHFRFLFRAGSCFFLMQQFVHNTPYSLTHSLHNKNNNYNNKVKIRRIAVVFLLGSVIFKDLHVIILCNVLIPKLNKALKIIRIMSLSRDLRLTD